MTETITIASVTKAPKLRPAKTEDGVNTGMWVTLAPSIALSRSGPMEIAAGTCITGSLAGGWHDALNSMYSARKIGHGGNQILYRA